MHVTIKLFANFRNDRFKYETRQVAPDARVRDIARSLSIAEEEIGVALVNGRHAELFHPLNPDDTVSLFPLIGGG